MENFLENKMKDFLNKRCCDVYENCTNTQTIRERIYDMEKYIGMFPSTDKELNNMSKERLEEYIEELDWLAWK